MKAPEVRYVRPESVEEALAVLAADAEATKVLAGGQSLLPVLNMRLAGPQTLLDISRIDALHEVVTGPDGRLSYGACVVHADFEDGRVPDMAGGMLRVASGGIGYRAIRNQGTVGGSLAHADPSAEWPVIMAALDAGVLVRSTGSQREIACSELFAGYFTTTLRADEIIVAVSVTPLAESTAWGFCKFARKVGEFAESTAAVVLRQGRRGAHPASVWLGGAAGTPVRLTTVEAALSTAATLTEDDVLALVATELSGLGAQGADDEYRRHLHGVITWRAVSDALARSARAAGRSTPEEER